VHVVESDTSAASGRSGRYEAYTLDFALFMEPRLRGLEHMEFWKRDEQRHAVGVREAPTYSLARARVAMSDASFGESTEDAIDRLESDVGTDEPGDTLTGDPTLF
jgi:hypothetical protein